MDLAGAAMALIDAADLPAHHKPGRLAAKGPAFRQAGFLLEGIQALLCRFQGLLEGLPPGGMGEIPGADQPQALVPGPKLQMGRVAIPAGGPGIFGVDVKVCNVHDALGHASYGKGLPAPCRTQGHLGVSPGAPPGPRAGCAAALPRPTGRQPKATGEGHRQMANRASFLQGLFFLFVYCNMQGQGPQGGRPRRGPGSKLGRQTPLPARRPYHGQMGRACFSGKFQNPLKRKTKYSILINKFMFLYTRIHVSNLCYPAAQGAGNALVPPLL